MSHICIENTVNANLFSDINNNNVYMMYMNMFMY